MKLPEKCIVCNSTEFDEFLKTKDFFLTQEDFSIYSCPSCGYKFTHPVPAPEIIGNYYKSTDYVSHSDTKKGLFFKLYHFIKKYNLRKKQKLIFTYKTSGNILDYGCGTGDFLGVFNPSVWHTTGIEPDTETRNYAIKKNNISVSSPEELQNLKPASFDVITLWHVLEHIADIELKINQLKSLLKPDGIIVIAVPNSNSYDALCYKDYWAGYDVPRHLHHFNPFTLEKFLIKHHFNIISKKNMFFDSFYVSILSEKYKKNIWGIFRAVWVGLFSNLKTYNKKYMASSIIFVCTPKSHF